MKTIARAFLYSILLNVVYHLIVPMLSGMFLTWMYVPDITDAYQSTGSLQQEVAFGQMGGTVWWQSLPVTLLLGMVISTAAIAWKRTIVRKRDHRK